MQLDEVEADQHDLVPEKRNPFRFRTARTASLETRSGEGGIPGVALGSSNLVSRVGSWC